MVMLVVMGSTEMEDDVPGSPGARCGEDGEEEGSKDHDHDIILVSSSPHKVTRWSVTPLSSSNRDIEAGSNQWHGIAAVSDRLKMTPSMMTAATQLLIQSTHALLDHPNKSLYRKQQIHPMMRPLWDIPLLLTMRVK